MTAEDLGSVTDTLDVLTLFLDRVDEQFVEFIVEEDLNFEAGFGLIEFWVTGTEEPVCANFQGYFV